MLNYDELRRQTASFHMNCSKLTPSFDRCEKMKNLGILFPDTEFYFIQIGIKKWILANKHELRRLPGAPKIAAPLFMDMWSRLPLAKQYDHFTIHTGLQGGRKKVALSFSSKDLYCQSIKDENPLNVMADTLCWLQERSQL